MPEAQSKETHKISTDPTAEVTKTIAEGQRTTSFHTTDRITKDSFSQSVSEDGVSMSIATAGVQQNAKVMEATLEFEKPVSIAVMDPSGTLPGTKQEESIKNYESLALRRQELETQIGSDRVSSEDWVSWRADRLQEMGYEAEVFQTQEPATGLVSKDIHVFGDKAELVGMKNLGRESESSNEYGSLHGHPNASEINHLMRQQTYDRGMEQSGSIPNPNQTREASEPSAQPDSSRDDPGLEL